MKTKLNQDDMRLFREAVRDVTPIPQKANALLPPSRRAPARARFARAARTAVLEEIPSSAAGDLIVEIGEELSFRRPGVQETVLRKLRRGEYRVEGEIDLHGLTVMQAEQALKQFLSAALARHTSCVRIIHGKGMRSGHHGPILKTAVSGLLRRMSAVTAFVSARPADGGTGALYVLLAR